MLADRDVLYHASFVNHCLLETHARRSHFFHRGWLVFTEFNAEWPLLENAENLASKLWVFGRSSRFSGV